MSTRGGQGRGGLFELLAVGRKKVARGRMAREQEEQGEGLQHGFKEDDERLARTVVALVEVWRYWR